MTLIFEPQMFLIHYLTSLFTFYFLNYFYLISTFFIELLLTVKYIFIITRQTVLVKLIEKRIQLLITTHGKSYYITLLITSYQHR